MSALELALAVALEASPPTAPVLCPRCLLRGHRIALKLNHECASTSIEDRCPRCELQRPVRVVALDERGSLSELEACGCYRGAK